MTDTEPYHTTIADLMKANRYIEAYHKTFPQWNLDHLANLPAYMHEGLVRYILCGVRPGDFLGYLLAGDLFAAMNAADSTNCQLFRSYCMFLHNSAPRECFGSHEQVIAWIERRGHYGPEEKHLAELTGAPTP